MIGQLILGLFETLFSSYKYNGERSRIYKSYEFLRKQRLPCHSCLKRSRKPTILTEVRNGCLSINYVWCCSLHFCSQPRSQNQLILQGFMLFFYSPSTLIPGRFLKMDFFHVIPNSLLATVMLTHFSVLKQIERQTTIRERSKNWSR
jgi:hypothetical protein